MHLFLSFAQKKGGGWGREVELRLIRLLRIDVA